MPKRPILQDRDIAQISSNVKTRSVLVELHFVTAEFDYERGTVFATQLLSHLERIAPHGPTKT